MEHVRIVNHLVDRYSLQKIKEYLLECDINDISQNADYIFQKTYLHICCRIRKAKRANDVVHLKLLQEIEQYFRTIYFNQLPEIQRIAIRHCITYGKYLMG